MSRLLSSDGITKNQIVVYPQNEVINGDTIAAGGNLTSRNFFKINHLYLPTLVLKWTPGGSTNFDVSINIYWDEISGLLLNNYNTKTGITTVANNGTLASLIPVSPNQNTTPEIVKIFIRNNDGARPITALYAKIVAGER